jgi:phage gpG-like protein
MFRFKLDIAGEIQMDRGIARFSDGCTDYRPIWGMVEDDFYAQEKAQFESAGAEGGEAWQELNPEYAGWKEAHYPGTEILVRSGDLVRSLTTGSDPNAVRVEERKTLTLGSRVPYAIYHQSILPRHRLPRRPEIMLTEPFKRGVMAHLHQYLVYNASQCGFRTGWKPGTAESLFALKGRGKSLPGFMHGLFQ